MCACEYICVCATEHHLRYTAYPVSFTPLDSWPSRGHDLWAYLQLWSTPYSFTICASLALQAHTFLSLFLSSFNSVVHQAMSTTPGSRRVRGHGSGPLRTFQCCQCRSDQWLLWFFFFCKPGRMNVVWNLTTIKTALTSHLISPEFHINTMSPSLTHAFIHLFNYAFTYWLTLAQTSQDVRACVCAWINKCLFMHE